MAGALGSRPGACGGIHAEEGHLPSFAAECLLRRLVHEAGFRGGRSNRADSNKAKASRIPAQIRETIIPALVFQRLALTPPYLEPSLSSETPLFRATPTSLPRLGLLLCP